MNKIDKVTSFKKLYNLLEFYYESRDQPVEEDFNFFDEVKTLCNELDLDYETFITEMQLNLFNS